MVALPSDLMYDLECQINLGRLVHSIEYHPNIQVNALLSIPSEFTLFFCRFSPKTEVVSFLGDSQQVSRTTCGLNIEHLINILLKDYLISLGFSIADMTLLKINKYLYQTQTKSTASVMLQRRERVEMYDD